MNKKLLFAALLVLVCVSFAYADAYKDVNRYIAQGLSKENLEKIRTLSPQLTLREKESIYTWKKCPTFTPFLSNLFLGFGSGSFNQGDSTHGILFLAGDTACLGLIAYNILKNGWENFINSIGGKSSGTDDTTLAKVALIAGLGLRVYQAARPFIYANKYNGNLRDALGLNSVTVAMVPTFSDGRPGMSLAARVSL